MEAKNREEAIIVALKTSDLSSEIVIQSISGVRLNETSELLVTNYDVNAKLEEKERKSGHVVIQFSLFVGTKPPLVKFEVAGTVTLSGKDSMIAKILETDPDTKTPYLLHKVYQRAFMSIFLLATILNMPYPPPNLLFSPKFNELFPEESKKTSEQNQVDKAIVPPQQNVIPQQQQNIAPQKQNVVPQPQEAASAQQSVASPEKKPDERQVETAKQ